MRVITLANQKGGSGKTATAAALLQAALLDGRKALAVDLDPQGNLTFTLGANANAGGAYELITGKAPAAGLIQSRDGAPDIIPASWDLQTLVTEPGSALRLQKALSPVAGAYDLIIIDTPPTPGELQYNALMASTDLLIPLQADIYGLQGLYQIADTAKMLQESNPRLNVLGVLLTRHTPHSNLVRQMEDVISSKAGEMGFPVLGSIREAVAVKEAAAMQEGLLTYAPKSKPAQDYWSLYRKIMKNTTEE